MHTPYLLLGIFVFLTACTTKLHSPILNAENRATPLSFGIYVTPDPNNNPISPPERFVGFHSAVDYEISKGELHGDVPVYAICPGTVVFRGFVEGYGGLVIHDCKLSGNYVTVLYGHLDFEGMPEKGTKVKAGQAIGLLAPERSYASGGNRKHLHLGIHKGKHIDYRGYVPTEEDLDSYINPADILPEFSLDLPGESPGETPYWKKD